MNDMSVQLEQLFTEVISSKTESRAIIEAKLSEKCNYLHSTIASRVYKRLNTGDMPEPK